MRCRSLVPNPNAGLHHLLTTLPPLMAAASVRSCATHHKKVDGESNPHTKLYSTLGGAAVGAAVGFALLASGVDEMILGTNSSSSNNNNNNSNNNTETETEQQGRRRDGDGVAPEPKAQQKVASTTKSPVGFPMRPPSTPLPPPQDKKFTVAELFENYSGEKDAKEVYVAVKGVVFKVDPEMYGKKGYPFAGVDASRCLAKAHLHRKEANADWSNLNEAHMAALNNWYEFYTMKYPIMGTLVTDAEFNQRGEQLEP